MKITPHQEVFLQQINLAGIDYSASHWALGSVELSAEQIQAFTEDSDQFVADQFGVSKELLLAWGEFLRTWPTSPRFQ